MSISRGFALDWSAGATPDEVRLSCRCGWARIVAESGHAYDRSMHEATCLNAEVTVAKVEA